MDEEVCQLGWVLLRREGWKVNYKRFRRLYRLEGVQLHRRVRRRIGEALNVASLAGPVPSSITDDHGTECQSRALEDGAYRRGVQVDFTRPGRLAEDALNESFNGLL